MPIPHLYPSSARQMKGTEQGENTMFALTECIELVLLVVHRQAHIKRRKDGGVYDREECRQHKKEKASYEM